MYCRVLRAFDGKYIAVGCWRVCVCQCVVFFLFLIRSPLLDWWRMLCFGPMAVLSFRIWGSYNGVLV